MDRPAAGFSLTAPVATWLVSDDGQERVGEAVSALDAGEDELAIASRLRASGLDPERSRGVLDVAHARVKARERYPDADRLLLTTTALEQASHPAAAAARAERYAGRDPVIDLCSGVGGDTLAIARAAGRVQAVDLDEARLTLLRHNAAVRGLEVETLVGDALEVTLPSGALVHADPGRRLEGRRLRRLGEYLPPVPDLLAHVDACGAAGAGVVVSPAVDLTDPGIPTDAELEFVQLGRQLLEASLWTGELRRGGAVARATLLDAGVSVSRDGVPVELAVGDVRAHLLEPAPAAVRARVHGALGEELGAHRLARRRALLTADVAPTSPWFDVWAVEDVLPLRPKALKRRLRDLDTAPIEIATHGVDADPEEWWRRLGRPPRGPDGRRLHLIRTDDGAICVISHRAG